MGIIIEQISFLGQFGATVTPDIPPEKQKKGMKGWVIEITGNYLVKNGFAENAVGVTVRRVELLGDTKHDRRGWWQNARAIDHCKGDGWYGGCYTIYAKKPTWAECEEYVRTHHKGEPYDYRIICTRKNGDATHSVCDYGDL